MEVHLETIRGKTRIEMDAAQLGIRLAGCQRVVLDLGTGDGRYVRHLAGQHPGWFVIGLDACRENLRVSSRRASPNTLFVIAAAEKLPHELHGLASHLTINFPWGSLLEGLLEPHAALLDGLAWLAARGASLEVRLNGEALAEAGQSLQTGAEQIRLGLSMAGWHLARPRPLETGDLRTFPSTWARRLAYGRDPRALLLSGSLAGAARQSPTR